MGRLDGHNALVTGGGTGIGFGCATQLLAAGARVTIAGRRGDVLTSAVERLRAMDANYEVDAQVCDITVEGDVEAAVEAACRGGHLDVLVANAGTGFPGAILQMDAAGWEASFRLNVVGTALCIKHAAQRMPSTGGSIIAISSTSGTKVQPWLASYVVSKAGLDMLVRCAAIELAPRHVRVNSVQPGYVPTETMSQSTAGPLDATLRRATPLGEAGTPDDVGRAVVFLASADAQWITGQDIGVDGGLNIPVMPSMAPIAARIYGADVVNAYALPDFTALGGD